MSNTSERQRLDSWMKERITENVRRRRQTIGARSFALIAKKPRNEDRSSGAWIYLPFRYSPATDQSVRFWGPTDLCRAGRPISMHGADRRHADRDRLDPRGRTVVAVHGIQRRETRPTDEYTTVRAGNTGARRTLRVCR